MKRYILVAVMFFAWIAGYAQSVVLTQHGTCGVDAAWTFDGKTLSIYNVSKLGLKVSIQDYDIKNNIAPWTKKKLPVRIVRIGNNIDRIGSCAFANCDQLTDVVFEGTTLQEIGWGAFLNCSRLRSISLPAQLRKIETIAFANCRSLTSVSIPDQCRVEDQAYANCTDIQSIEVSPTAALGQYVFASEISSGSGVRHALYNGEIRRLPVYMNVGNCNTFGISKGAMEIYTSATRSNNAKGNEYDYATSEIDTVIPQSDVARNNTYALIIGNQNYRFVPEVPYAIHDARTFNKYCEKTLGIPAENIHLCEDATKQMIDEEEFDWLESIQDRGDKKLVVYYAGHGVPDTKNQNKAYLLPTDVRGTKPSHGIALDDFYSRLGDLAFQQTSVFLDACFSGINRDNESVNEGMRGVEIAAEDANLGGNNGNMIVFSAAQGNETAQGFQEQGHGLFTYYLLKDLQDSDGQITYGELSDYIKSHVSRKALTLKLRKPQTPSVNTTQSINATWRDLGF